MKIPVKDKVMLEDLIVSNNQSYHSDMKWFIKYSTVFFIVFITMYFYPALNLSVVLWVSFLLLLYKANHVTGDINVGKKLRALKEESL